MEVGHQVVHFAQSETEMFRGGNIQTCARRHREGVSRTRKAEGCATGRVGQAEEAFREGSDAMVARRPEARTEEMGLHRRIEPIHVVAAEVSDNAKPASRIQCDLGMPSVHVEVRGISRGRLCRTKE